MGNPMGNHTKKTEVLMKKLCYYLMIFLLVLTVSACRREEGKGVDPLIPGLDHCGDRIDETEETDPPVTETEPESETEVVTSVFPPVPETAKETPVEPETPDEGEESVIELRGEETDPHETDVRYVPTDDVYTMTIASRYEELYQVLSEKRKNGNRNDYYYLTDGAFDMAVAVPEVSIEAETMAAATEAVMEAPTMEAPMEKDEASVSNAAGDYSGTNVQVTGIDEGDIVKTDGKYIYVLKNNRELVILSADGEKTKVLSSFTVEKAENNSNKYPEDADVVVYEEQFGTAQELYIYEGFLSVIVSVNEHHIMKAPGQYTQENKSYTLIVRYDVRDPEDPLVASIMGQDGNYVNSRMTDGEIFLITRYYLNDINDIKEDDYETYIPRLYDNKAVTLVRPDCIVYPEDFRQSAYTVIGRYHAMDGDRSEIKTVVGAGESLYMSPSAMYLAETEYYHETSEPYTQGVYTVTDHNSGTRTNFIKVSVEDRMETTAVGSVPGGLLNQFSMDEYDGTLRVVTTVQDNSYQVYVDEELGFTNYRYSDSRQTNALWVLDEHLDLVGSITGLAENERVYSVRFSGEVGYFVTFRQVDPLFAVDLSDPANPVITSELKIPGFSNYLHPYETGLLLGIGQDADENTGRTGGLKLSMFDVSDPYDVIERDKLILKDSYSEAQYNHKAILVSAKKDLIGFPVAHGYVIYGYNKVGGFYERNRITFDDWKWSGGNIRGLYVDDEVYIVSGDRTVVFDLTTFDILARVNY